MDSNPYSSQKDYIDIVSDASSARRTEIEQALVLAFDGYLETRSVEVILFSSMDVLALAAAVEKHPLVLKPLLILCNVAGRAIERDLGIRNIDTYKPSLGHDEALAIAGYLKPFLPTFVELPTLVNVDRIEFIDKEIRSLKGRWEKQVLQSLNRFGQVKFRKRKFVWENEKYEIDAASPTKGPISIGVDVKRIEARRDIHKRCDEIVNKANNLKQAYPGSVFVAVIYYPFIDEHLNVRDRLKSSNIDHVIFCGSEQHSIDNPVRLLLSSLEVKHVD